MIKTDTHTTKQRLLLLLVVVVVVVAAAAIVYVRARGNQLVSCRHNQNIRIHKLAGITGERQSIVGLWVDEITPTSVSCAISACRFLLLVRTPNVNLEEAKMLP